MRLRNGGFERGSIDFWQKEYGDGYISIDDSNPKYGSYAGSCIRGSSSGGSSIVVMNTDYIEVLPYNLVELSVWAKSNSGHNPYLFLCMYMYDSDYSYIGSKSDGGITLNTNYQQTKAHIQVDSGVKYIRVGINISANFNLGSIVYFDGYAYNIVGSDSCIIHSKQLYYDTVTYSGETDTASFVQFSKYYADLVVVSLTGSSPTFDVSIYEKTLGNDPILVGSFTQVTASLTNERISLPLAIGYNMYAKWIITGGGSCTFGIYLYGKH